MDTTVSTEEAVALLCKLIETPRTSRNEAEAASVIERFAALHSLPCRRIGANIIFGKGELHSHLPTLLLCAHIDTVKPTPSWTRNPHKATMEGDRLYGLGSNDDGASVVSLLQAYRLLCQSSQNCNLILALTAEEEVSGHGGIESVLPLLPPIDAALVGEPTDMQPAVAEKGLMVLDVVAHGQAGHAARSEGDNAIYHAMDCMQWFRTYQFPKRSKMLGGVKMTVTMVNAGTQHNVVPAQCSFTVDVRTNELYSNQEIFETVSWHVSEVLPHHGGEVHARSLRLGSSHISETHPLVRRAVALGRTPFGSPTLSDQALMPFPSMKMGPGSSQRSHTADEFVLVSEIREAITLYYNLLNGISLT